MFLLILTVNSYPVLLPCSPKEESVIRITLKGTVLLWFVCNPCFFFIHNLKGIVNYWWATEQTKWLFWVGVVQRPSVRQRWLILIRSWVTWGNLLVWKTLTIRAACLCVGSSTTTVWMKPVWSWDNFSSGLLSSVGVIGPQLSEIKVWLSVEIDHRCCRHCQDWCVCPWLFHPLRDPCLLRSGKYNQKW